MTPFETVLMAMGGLQLLLLLYFVSHVGRLKAIEDSTHKAVILLTVIANRGGATQDDVAKALSK